MLKRITTVFCCLLSMFSLYSCGDSEEQKQLNKQHIETAKVNAQNYIMQKYGFEAKITDAVLERAYMWIGSRPLTTVYIRMEHDGRKFGVYIDGSTSNTDGYDNYQAEELRTAVQEECEKLLSGVRYVYISSNEVYTVYDSIENECINMHHAFFDGTNAADILTAASCSITVCYVDTDLSAIPAHCSLQNNYSKKFSDSITFISYRSEKELEIGLGYGDKPIYSPLYIDSSYEMTTDGNTLQSYEIGTYDNFYYYVEDSRPDSVHFEKIIPDAPSSWRCGEQYEFSIASDAYSIRTDGDCTVYVYFPIDQIENYGYSTNFARCSTIDKETRYSCSSIWETDMPYHSEKLNIASDEKCYFLFLDENRK